MKHLRLSSCTEKDMTDPVSWTTVQQVGETQAFQEEEHEQTHQGVSIWSQPALLSKLILTQLSPD